jgi:hypothetical protein
MRGGGADETDGRTTTALPVFYGADGVTNIAVVDVPDDVLPWMPEGPLMLNDRDS